MQRALMQFFKPENYFMVREALLKAGRADLIGNGCDCLIPAQSAAGKRSRHGGGGRMRQAKATITIRSPTRRRASRPASAGCRIKGCSTGAEDGTSSGHDVGNGKAAVVDRSLKRLGLVP